MSLVVLLPYVSRYEEQVRPQRGQRQNQFDFVKYI